MPWELGTRVRMRHDGWHLNPHPTVFLTRKELKPAKTSFLGWWWYKDIPKAIIDNYNYNILQYCHSSYSIQYHIHYSVWLSYKYIQISCHYCNGSTYISSEFPSKSPCWSQPPRLHGRASQLTMNFWGVDVERVKVLDQPMTKTQNSIFVILASLLSPPATPTTSIIASPLNAFHLPSQPLFCPHPPLSVCLAIKVSLPIMPQLLLDLLGLAPIHSMLVNSCGSFYSITHSVPSKSHNLSSILCRQPEDVAYVAWLSPKIKATNSILSSLLPNNICTYK